MNTNAIRSTIGWPAGKTISIRLSSLKCWDVAIPLRRSRYFGCRLVLAVLPALALVVGTVWAVSVFDPPGFLQALAWAAGFVFLALAMESNKPNIGALLASGLALPVLALLSALVATEFLILAAVLVAAWIPAAVLKF